MADTKITALTALTAADPINDVIPIVDVSDTTMAASGTTKKISVNNILSSSPTASGAFTVSGLVTAGSATITGALTVDTTTLVVNPSGYADRVGIGTTTPDATLDVTSAGTASLYTVSAVIQDGTYPASGNPTLEFNGFIGGNGYRSGIGSIGGQQLAFYIPTTFGVPPSLAMTLNSTGNLVLKGGTTGANGVGVTFPVTPVASSDAKCLDDYEEGTWTIGLTFGGGNTGLTTVLNTGRYTKVGRQVTVCGRLELSNKGTSTGAAVITGLPFSIANANEAQQAASFRFNGVSYTGAFQGYGTVSSTTIPLEQISEAGSNTNLTDSNFVNGTSIHISLTYTV